MTIVSKPTSSAGCECGRDFPMRIAFLPTQDPVTIYPTDTFLITCRCGRTYPLAVEATPLEGPMGTPREPEPPTVTPKRQGAVMAGAATIVPTIAPAPRGFTPTPTLSPTGRGTSRLRCMACGNTHDAPAHSPQVECPSCGVMNHRTLP